MAKIAACSKVNNGSSPAEMMTGAAGSVKRRSAGWGMGDCVIEGPARRNLGKAKLQSSDFTAILGLRVFRPVPFLGSDRMTWLQFDGVGKSVGGAVSQTSRTIGNQSLKLGPLELAVDSVWLWVGLALAVVLVIWVTRR